MINYSSLVALHKYKCHSQTCSAAPETLAEINLT